jgi:two-component system sensor histidine kinase/response regulator
MKRAKPLPVINLQSPQNKAPRVLIVDDEKALMTAQVTTLRDHGFETVGFRSATEALSAMEEARFDILLADLTLPEMDGIALLRAALEKDPQLIGIIVAEPGTIGTAVDAMQDGAFDYVLKPFNLSAVLPVLNRALTVRQLRLENAALEATVRDRTAELQAAKEELAAFSYSMSHDLRAPLRALKMFSAVLMGRHQQELSDEVKRLLGFVDRGAQQINQLVEDLLRFSRVGRQPLAKRQVDMTALVRAVAQEVEKNPNDRLIDFRLSDLPPAFGDDALLRELFLDLLSNAFKFTRPRPSAMIEVGAISGSGEPIYFVRDNGVGFDMKHAKQLFGIFSRLHTDEQFEGTGIGLAIVKRIVNRHGGHIWVDAAPDRGATFYFTLGA